VLLPSLFLFAVAGACSTFGDEGTSTPTNPAVDAGADASSTDGPPIESGDGGDQPVDAAGFCGRCEGKCLPADAGCEPFDPAPAFPADGTITGLDVGVGDVYVATTSNNGSLIRIDIPKHGFTTTPVEMVFGRGVIDVALLGSYVHSAFTSTSAATKTFLGHVAKGSGPGAIIVPSNRGSARVAANQNYAYGATDSELHACNRADLYNACDTLGSPGVIIARLVAAGLDTYCFHGKWEDPDGGPPADVGVYCGQNASPPVLRQAVGAVTALTLRGNRVFWAADGAIASESATGASDPRTFPAAGVTALTTDPTDLFFATATQIFRCPKDTCLVSERVALTAADGIDRLAISADHVYFTYSAGTAKHIGRVPRRP